MPSDRHCRPHHRRSRRGRPPLLTRPFHRVPPAHRPCRPGRSHHPIRWHRRFRPIHHRPRCLRIRPFRRVPQIHHRRHHTSSDKAWMGCSCSADIRPGRNRHPECCRFAPRTSRSHLLNRYRLPVRRRHPDPLRRWNHPHRQRPRSLRHRSRRSHRSRFHSRRRVPKHRFRRTERSHTRRAQRRRTPRTDARRASSRRTAEQLQDHPPSRGTQRGSRRRMST
jgi:hypothetical protein